MHPNTHTKKDCIYRVRQKKSNPLSYFANFSATALNFLTKLCNFILCSYRHTTAKYRLIILTYDKVM